MGQIPAPRSPFTDPESGQIRREWFLWLLRITNQLNSNLSLTDIESMFLSDANPYGLTPQPSIGVEPRAISDQSLIPAQSINFERRFEPDWSVRFEQNLAQLRQQVNDAQTLAELAPVAQLQLPSGDNVTSDTVSAVGYWSPLTNGDPVTPELVFDMAGDTISVWTPTP